MKRILTLIVTLVCIFAAYSQNTVYIWTDNTLSVQAADSITIDRSFGNWIDLGLSVLWNKQNETLNGFSWLNADKKYGSLSDGSRLPKITEFRELINRCTYRYDNNGYGYYTGIYGNTIVFASGDYYWTASSYVYWSGGSVFQRNQGAYARVRLVLE